MWLDVSSRRVLSERLKRREKLELTLNVEVERFKYPDYVILRPRSSILIWFAVFQKSLPFSSKTQLLSSPGLHGMDMVRRQHSNQRDREDAVTSGEAEGESLQEVPSNQIALRLRDGSCWWFPRSVVEQTKRNIRHKQIIAVEIKSFQEENTEQHEATLAGARTRDGS